MNEQQILQLLLDANICNKNIFPNVAPLATPLPHGRYEVIKTPQGTSLVQDDYFRIRFDLSIWAKTYNDLKTIEQQIRNVFKSKGREISATTSYENETKYHRLEFYWYFIETN